MSKSENKRVLVLGGNGMLGHRLAYTLSMSGFEVGASFRQGPQWSLGSIRPFIDCDARVPDGIKAILSEFAPMAVINCLGVLKKDSQDNREDAETVNARLPKFLSEACVNKCRFIHISTDCVFSGKTGCYREQDLPDPIDSYGIWKLEGESIVQGLVLRTSFIGHELETKRGLLEWLIHSLQHEVPGYRQAFFSGLTTNECAAVITRIITHFPDLNGLYHVAGPRISKLDLLTMIRDVYELSKVIYPDDSVRYDRSLDSIQFRTQTGYRSPEWLQMTTEMRNAGRLM